MAADPHLREQVERAIADNPVLLFMKGTPDMPRCGFSAQTARILDDTGVEYAAMDVLPDPRIRQVLSAHSNWPTIPQLFVDGELVGGCDIVTEMYETGELHEALGAEKPAEVAQAPAAEPTGPRPLGIENRLG